jgi:hypothetical protein
MSGDDCGSMTGGSLVVCIGASVVVVDNDVWKYVPYALAYSPLLRGVVVKPARASDHLMLLEDV